MFYRTNKMTFEEKRGITMKRYLCIFAVLLAFVSQTMADNAKGMSVWDYALPTMQLNNVTVNATSLEDAWKQISTSFLLRSVLVVSEISSTSEPFSFETAQCSGEELLNALKASYDDFIWTQDDKTGVIWFHPKDLEIGNILSFNVSITDDQLGLPMQTGILEPIEDLPSANITVKRWGAIFNNTFNYPVDLFQGEYVLRDLLNICCTANPTKTFYVKLFVDGNTSITAVNLVSDEADKIPPGALFFWTLEIDNLDEQIPSEEQIMVKLASTDPKIRWAARIYVEAIIWNISVDEWVNRAQDEEQNLWVCLGVTNIIVRSEEATHVASREKMNTLISEQFLKECSPSLAVLVALCSGKLNKNASVLDLVSTRDFSTGAFANIKSEVNYYVRTSSTIRNALKTKGHQWLSTPEPSFENIGNLPQKAIFAN